MTRLTAVSSAWLVSFELSHLHHNICPGAVQASSMYTYDTHVLRKAAISPDGKSFRITTDKPTLLFCRCAQGRQHGPRFHLIGSHHGS